MTVFLFSLLFSLCPVSHGSCQYQFKLTNRGQRRQRLYWRNDGFLPSTQTCKGGNLSGPPVLPPISSPRNENILTQGSVLSSRREKPLFSLSPSYVELLPGCSVDTLLTVSSDSPKVTPVCLQAQKPINCVPIR